ncbi:Zinc finger protein RME1 [Pleurostoma richardsiae]|uniref:Zinc finger protein RME1 n=1 Tax=Pleurostoma richardsiae TaxID=41990 RepID=A0AA38SE16_9PEZI|nr:Zinc finger protein RME1 [Pleurostoma richardsiae]
MAAESLVGHGLDRGASVTAGYDPSLDPAIKALLDQQADIQAKLAALLPQKYGPNINVELDMLRHKFRVLRTYAEDNHLTDKITVLSEIEEARSLQYQCECIESTCLDQGLDLPDAKVIEATGIYHQGEAPIGFATWFDKNLQHYDPVSRAWRLKDSLPLAFRSSHSFKCWDDRCMHYVYGFPNQEERDQHVREHVVPTKRDSGLSVGSTPPFIFPDQPGHRQYSLDYSKQASSMYLPRPGVNPPPPPPSSAGLSRDNRDSLRSYSFVSEHPGNQPRGSVDSEVDPLLPPLKRSRVGQSRLESIEELRLLRDIGPCLRCKILKKGCDSHDPCSLCPDQASSADNDYWKVLGCHRGPLASFAEVMIPPSIAPLQGHTPMASPLAQRRNMNEFLDRTYPISLEQARMVKAQLDFDDGFWWTEDLANLPPANPTVASFSHEPVEMPPPILRVLAASWNMTATAYNFWHLLKLSAARPFDTRRDKSLASSSAV